MSCLRHLVVLVLLTAAVQFWPPPVAASEITPERADELIFLDQALNQRGRQPNSLFLGSVSGLNLENPNEIFAYVFSQLPAEQWVLPTEDHLYFRFFLDGNFVWGNIHLAPNKRDLGQLVMPYYLYRPGLKGPEDTHVYSAVMGRPDGLKLDRVNDLTYKAEFRDKQVVFKLNNLSQEPPEPDKIGPNEIVLFKLHDESNLQFHLLFNTKHHDFFYVLHEAFPTEYLLVEIAPNLFLDQVSEFVFYADKNNGNRKILAGVKQEHIRANDYYDGPADQLADNFIEDDTLKQCVQLAYPYTKGHIDRRATFGSAARVAISPYFAYPDLPSLIQLVEDCEADDGPGRLTCIAPDFQKMVSQMRAKKDLGVATVEPGGHMTNITWHYEDATRLPPGGGHMTAVTWHYELETFLPPGGSHMVNVTWHYRDVSFLPPGGLHMLNVTWHLKGETFLPPGGTHMLGVTWHLKDVSFLPPGGGHMSGITWHLKDETFLPPGSGHMTGVTWHYREQTFLPPGGSHMTNVSWHLREQTFLPPGGLHMQDVTWHLREHTFLPPGGVHMQHVSWHRTDATFMTESGTVPGVKPVKGVKP